MVNQYMLDMSNVLIINHLEKSTKNIWQFGNYFVYLHSK
jgi:hypothetical protein